MSAKLFHLLNADAAHWPMAIVTKIARLAIEAESFVANYFIAIYINDSGDFTNYKFTFPFVIILMRK